MALDGIYLCSIVKELKETLLNGKVDKINQPETDEVIMSIRKDRINYNLLISASSMFPKIHLSDIRKVNPKVPPQFCMVLRKYLQSSSLIDIKQVDTDRIVKLYFEGTDDFGFHSIYILIVEIMGRHSNITLLRERDNKIIDAVKHITPDINSYRTILPGALYVAPPASNKLSLNATEESVVNFIKDNGIVINKNLFLNLFTGVSSQLSKDIFERFKEELVNGNICSSINYLRSIFSSISYITYLKEEKPFDFYCAPLVLCENLEKREYTSPSKQIEDFYIEKDRHDRLNVKSSALQRLVTTNIERVLKKLSIFKKDLEEAALKDDFRKKGELLTANIYMIKKGMSDITVSDYYKNPAEDITINLIVNKSPSENIQRYYKKYNKLKKSEEAAGLQIESATEELNYLNSVLTLLKNADTYNEIDEIKRELFETGYIKHKIKDNKKNNKSKPSHFVTEDGIDIYVGKNNYQNDYLTLKFADNRDIWMHTKNIPGSHVIIKTLNEITEETLLKAANLAAYYSHGRESTKVPVDYTEVKNVKKPNGAKPGMVIYTTNKTIYVNPEKPDLKKIE